MTIFLIMYFLFVHWVAGFVCQPDAIAEEKWKSNVALLIHGLIYALVATLSIVPVGILQCTLVPCMVLEWYIWALAATVLVHPVIDFFTSKAVHIYFEEKDLHWGFVVIGFDQFLHMAVFLLAYGLGPKLPLLIG